jgi:hypothetical protein
MRLEGLVAFMVVLTATGGAAAHHPGSHAARLNDRQVKLDVAATVGETCLAMGTVRTGTPRAVLPPPGATPVTAEVVRTGAACSPGAASIRAEQVIEVGQDVRQIHLYVVGPDGVLLGTERIPVR